jgi:hypothetical protein
MTVVRNRALDHLDETFRHRLRSPIPWINIAEVLRRDGDILWRRYRRAARRLAKDSESRRLFGHSKRWDLHSHYAAMMLWGFAIENLLKSIIIAREGDSSSGDRLPKHLGDHDVGRLLNRSGVLLTDADRRVADRLHEAVIWGGRYPIPKDSKAMTFGLAPEDIDRKFAALFRRIRRIADSSRKHYIRRMKRERGF